LEDSYPAIRRNCATSSHFIDAQKREEVQLSKTLEDGPRAKAEVRPRMCADAVDDVMRKGLLKLEQTSRDVKLRVAVHLGATGVHIAARFSARATTRKPNAGTYFGDCIRCFNSSTALNQCC
jgi:hypothetical protein